MPLHSASHTIEGNLVVKGTVHEQSHRGEDGNSERRDEMRKLVAVTQMTLDGVMQALGGPEEDPSGSVPTSRRVRARFVSWSVYALVKLPSFEGMGTAET